MSETEVKTAWHRHWVMGDSLEDTASPMGKWLRHQRIQLLKEMLKPLNKSMKAIDMGCGNGSTLSVLRSSGFSNSIGIEYIEDGLHHAEKRGFTIGRDIFLGDAKATSYPDRSFSLVFSEGLWEHFEDPSPFIDEFCRISKEYVLVIQPNHFSIVGGMMKNLWELLNSEKGGVKEYSYHLEFFTGYLRAKGFILIDQKATIIKLVLHRIIVRFVKTIMISVPMLHAKKGLPITSFTITFHKSK